VDHSWSEGSVLAPVGGYGRLVVGAWVMFYLCKGDQAIATLVHVLLGALVPFSS
jgi:hypothetical protein